MTDLPDKIDTQYKTDGGRWRTKLDIDLIEELVDNYNQLIDYLSDIERSSDD